MGLSTVTTNTQLKILMFRLLSIFTLIIGFAFQLSAQKGYEITVKLEGYSNDTIRIANYLMDKQYIRDTAVLDTKTGTYTFTGEEPLEPGMYLIVMPPENKFFQILINEKEEFFSIETNPEKPAETMKIKGSADNELFYDYLNFLGEQRPLSDKYRKELEEETDEKKKDAIQAKLENLNDAVNEKQQSILNDHSTTLTAAIIKANQSPVMPEIKGKDDKDTQILQWQWTRKHYFDNIDLADPRFLRLPFLFQRVNHYIEKLTVQHPDSISKSLIYILDKMEPASDNFKYYLVHYLGEYAKSKVVGFDAIYVDLVESYYMTGKATWTDEEQLKKIIKNAKTIKPLLIGKIAPDISMETQEGTKMTLHGIESPFTILIFWDPECGHCKKAMPKLLEFYADYKDRGVEIVAVCTRFMKETQNCWDFIAEKEIGVWLNTVDPYHRSKYKLVYDIRSTPQIYVLDSKKEIISKKIGSEQLEEVMDQMILREKEIKDKSK
jgi:thiol-disulfide isomerase/thioredoxin